MMGDRAACTKPAVIFVVLACFLFPLLRLLILVRDFTVEILYYQQLDFYDAYFQKLSWAQIFRFQHGEHRLGVGGILQAIVLDASSWRNSAVSYSIVTVLLLAALSVLFLKRRMSGRLEIIDGALPILFLTSNQYETIVIAPSLAAQALPLLLISVFPLILFVQRRSLCYLSLSVLAFLSIFTGYGYVIGMVLVPILLLILIRSICFGPKSEAWYSLAALGAVGLAFFDFARNLEWVTSVACFTFPHQPIFEYLIFIALMPAKFIGFSYLLMPRLALIVGFMLLGLTSYVLWARIRTYWRSGESLSLAIVLLIMFALTFDGLTAVGRVCLGLYASGSPRYMTLMIPLFGGLFLHFALAGKRRGAALAGLMGVLAVGGYMPIRLSARASLADQVRFEQEWHDCYLRTESVSKCYETVQGVLHPDPTGTHLEEKLQFLKAHHLNLYAP